MRWVAIGLAVLGCACSSGEGNRGLDDVEAAALRECLRGLSTLDAAEPHNRVWYVAETCAGAQPSFARLAVVGSDQRLELLADETDFLCKDDARVALSEVVGARMPALINACGANYYGLPSDATWALSPAWFVIQRVGAWLTGARAKAEHSHPDLVRPLDAAVAEARFPLELPVRAPGLYTLPKAHHHVRIDAAAFVLIVHKKVPTGAMDLYKDEIRVGVLPEIGFTKGGAKLLRGDGPIFPGKVVDKDAIRTALSWVSGTAKVLIIADAGYPAALVQHVAAGIGELESHIAVDGYGAQRASAARLPMRKRSYVSGALILFKMDSLSVSAPGYGEELIRKDGDDFQWADFQSRLTFVKRHAPGDSVTVSIRDQEAKVKTLVKAMEILAATKRTRIDIAVGADVIRTADVWHKMTISDPLGGGLSGGTLLGGGGFGGGTGWGALGTPIGRGKGAGQGAGKVRLGRATASGSLDKNLIRRYVRRRVGLIRQCYRIELAKDPRLKGTVIVRFTIQPDGTVRKAVATGMSLEIARCVEAVINRIAFPRPVGGGVVEVRYPFTLRPG